jgi:hypothetical protein
VVSDNSVYDGLIPGQIPGNALFHSERGHAAQHWRRLMVLFQG